MHWDVPPDAFPGSATIGPLAQRLATTSYHEVELFAYDGTTAKGSSLLCAQEKLHSLEYTIMRKVSLGHTQSET